MAKDYWETPWDVVENINRLRPLTIDVACQEHNAKCPLALTDALNSDWKATQDLMGGWIWCNPPYSDPSPWVDQFITSGARGVMLVNLAGSAKWFHSALKHASELWVLRGRIGFYDPDVGTITTQNDRSQAVFVFGQHQGGVITRSIDVNTLQTVRKPAIYRELYGDKHK